MLEAVRLVQPLELALEGSLVVERLDDGHPRDGLGQLRRDRRDPRPDVRERRVRAPLEPARDEEPGREDEQGDEAEAPVEQEQASDRGDQGQRVHDEGRQPLVEHIRERVDVAREARDDPAGLLLGEVAERQGRQVLEQVAAEVEHHALPDAREQEPGRRAERPGDGADGDVRDDVAHRRLLVLRADPVVDRVADDVPADDRRRGGDRGEGEHEQASRWWRPSV